jgi:hypothetical protein
MMESLAIYTDDVYKILHENILKGKYCAVKIWFERTYGKPTERENLTGISPEVPLFNLINFKQEKKI